MSLPLEAVLLLAGVSVCVCTPRTILHLCSSAGAMMRVVTVSRTRTCIVSFVLPLLVLPLCVIRGGVPLATVHDEYVYLMMGETFAEGRLTNRTPTHWEALQSPHLLMRPTYQGKYPPAQGLFIAAGQFLTGIPLAGVWLSFACASVSLCWMIQGCAPNRWAFIGVLLFVLHPMVAIAWGETYWGGAVASAGGALLFGSLFRLHRKLSVSSSGLFGVALVVLANSRPFEGFLLSVIGGIWWLIIGARTVRARNWAGLQRLVWPTLGVFCAGVVAMGAYNTTVTGSAFKMPYQLWIEQHASSDGFLALLYRTGDIRRVIHPETGRLNMSSMSFKIARHYFFFVRLALLVPLLAAPSIIRRWYGVPVCVGFLAVYTGVVSNSYPGFPHYFAPATPLFFLLCIHGIRVMSLRPGRLRAVAAVCVATVIVCGGVTLDEWSRDPYEPGKQWVYAREAVERYLEHRPGRDIVIVAYIGAHDRGDEWVWNGSQPDSQSIMWAHSRGVEEDNALLKASGDRQAWILSVGDSSCRLRSSYEADGEGQEVTFAYRRGTHPVIRHPHSALRSGRKSHGGQSDTLAAGEVPDVAYAGQ